MKKVKEIDDEDEWSIKGFKSFSIAAVEYFPEYTSTCLLYTLTLPTNREV